jgi:hypothetical protein
MPLFPYQSKNGIKCVILTYFSLPGFFGELARPVGKVLVDACFGKRRWCRNRVCLRPGFPARPVREVRVDACFGECRRSLNVGFFPTRVRRNLTGCAFWPTLVNSTARREFRVILSRNCLSLNQFRISPNVLVALGVELDKPFRLSGFLCRVSGKPIWFFQVAKFATCFCTVAAMPRLRMQSLVSLLPALCHCLNCGCPNFRPRPADQVHAVRI